MSLHMRHGREGAYWTDMTSGRRGARLGQHFLTGTWAAAKLAEVALPAPDTLAVEIGPGKGALTKELLRAGARVVAIEKDTSLVPILENTFQEELASGRLTLITGDVRDIVPGDATQGEPYVLAANIPYYITGEIIRAYLTASHQPFRAALLVQKAVAERVVARDGKESILSLSVKVFGNPHIAAKVSKGNFSPPPSVDSAILVIDDISRARLQGASEKLFFETVRTGFSSKRKLLAGNLAKRWGREQTAGALDASGIAPGARAEDVPLDAWIRLTNTLAGI